MIDEAVIERALQAWAVAGTGLPPGRVILTRQAGGRREGPWLDLGLTSVAQFGSNYQVVEPNPAPAPGREIQIRHLGYRPATVSLRCFADPTGAGSPMAYLRRLVDRASFGSQLELLRDAGIGLLRFDPINDFSGPLGVTKFEPRAQVQMFINLASEEIEFTTYIGSVELVNAINNTTQIVGPEP